MRELLLQNDLKRRELRGEDHGRRWFNPADGSVWVKDPPPGCVEVEDKDKPAVEAALRAGDHPRLENGAWRIYPSADPPPDVLLHNLRHERDQRLRDCDWTQMPDVEIDPTKRQAWADYRRALRSLPQQHPDGRNVVWPNKPE